MRDRALLRLLAAQGLSSVGTSTSTVALAVMVFALTGSVLQMGVVLAASALPLAVMSFLGGALLDRFDSRRLMVVSDLARAALILLMPFSASASPRLIYLVAACIGVFSALFGPSQVKAVADICRPEQLVKANSHLSAVREGGEFAGYLIGGALVGSVGYTATFVLDSVSYLASASLLIGLPVAGRTAPVEKVVVLLRESPAILRHILRVPALRSNLLFALLPMLVAMMATPNAYSLALQVYDKGPGGFAAMEFITSLGWLAGGVLSARLDYKGDRNTYVFASLLLMAACFLGVGVSGSFWLSVGLLAVAVVGNVGVIVGSMTLFQEIQERPDKGRLIALRAGFGQLGGTLGLLVGGAVGSIVGVTPLFRIVGAAMIVLSLPLFLSYRAAVRKGRAFTPEGDGAA